MSYGSPLGSTEPRRPHLAFLPRRRRVRARLGAASAGAAVFAWRVLACAALPARRRGRRGRGGGGGRRRVRRRRRALVAAAAAAAGARADHVFRRPAPHVPRGAADHAHVDHRQRLPVGARCGAQGRPARDRLQRTRRARARRVVAAPRQLLLHGRPGALDLLLAAALSLCRVPEGARARQVPVGARRLCEDDPRERRLPPRPQAVLEVDDLPRLADGDGLRLPLCAHVRLRRGSAACPAIRPAIRREPLPPRVAAAAGTSTR